jgi:hypothetical protein
VGAEWRRRDDVQQRRRRSSDGWRRWQGPAVPEEKGEDEAHTNCESRRTEDRLTEETEIDAGGGSDIWWRGGEAAGGRRGQAQQGARR